MLQDSKNKNQRIRINVRSHLRNQFNEKDFKNVYYISFEPVVISEIAPNLHLFLKFLTIMNFRLGSELKLEESII